MAKSRITATSNRTDRKSRYLLLVDSNANNLFYLSMLLQRLNYQIYSARTAGEAIEMATVAAPSLIVTSLDLEDMPGLRLVQQLKKDSSLADVPFIALIRRDDLIGKQQSFELGAAESLYHPVSPELLYRAVQAAVETTPRTSIRIRTRLLVTVNNLPLEYIEGTCVSELSEHGMFLRTTTPAAVNTRLSLQFDLGHALIAIEAIVVFSSLTGGGSIHEPGMGLEFVRISTKDQDLIRQFIRNEITRGIAPMNA
jgi:CheY-like chemotaxis protein